MRILIAVIVSSISVLPLYFAVGILSSDFDNQLWLPVLTVALAISTIGVIGVGLPLHFFLTWRRQAFGRYYALAGFFAPTVTTLLTRPFGEDGVFWTVWQACLLGSFGATIALIFWRIAAYESAT